MEMGGTTPEKKMTEEEILKQYGDTIISFYPNPPGDKKETMTVKEAMNCWLARSWHATNDSVDIRFDEDYGHTLTVRKKEKQ